MSKLQTWGDLPVVDATENLRLMVLQPDIETGQRMVPACCAFSNACTRSYGSGKVVFYRSVCYVEMADESGRKIIERYTMGTRTEKFIREFDEGKAVKPGAYVLNAPRPSERLLSEGKKARNRRAVAKRKAEILAGTRVPGVYNKKETPVTADVAMVRTGKGRVRFTGTPAVGIEPS